MTARFASNTDSNFLARRIPRVLHSTRMTLLLTGSDVAALLTLDDCISAVEDAFRAHGEGRLHAPGILSAHEERGAFHIKTASVNGRFGAKANANFPGQTPSIQGVMLL